MKNSTSRYIIARKRASHLFLGGLLTVLFLTMAPVIVSAQTLWIGPDNGSWGNANYWTNGAPVWNSGSNNFGAPPAVINGAVITMDNGYSNPLNIEFGGDASTINIAANCELETTWGGILYNTSALATFNLASHATFYVDSGSLGHSQVNLSGSGSRLYLNWADAGSGVITSNSNTTIIFCDPSLVGDSNAGGSASITNWGVVNFDDDVKAGNGGMHISNGAGGTTNFNTNTSAGNAYLSTGGAKSQINFYFDSSAGTATILNTDGGQTVFTGGEVYGSPIINNWAQTATTARGSTSFVNQGWIVTGTINNFASTGNQYLGGQTNVSGGGSPGSATINNYGATVAGGNGGSTIIQQYSTADGNINNTGASTAGATSGSTVFQTNSVYYGSWNTAIHNMGSAVAGVAGGATILQSSASLIDGIIYNDASTVMGGSGGFTLFQNSSYAAGLYTYTTGTLCNMGSVVSGGGGGYTIFADQSSAGYYTTSWSTPSTSEVLIANSGSNGGGGGYIEFAGQSTGTNALVQVYGNGFLDISQLQNPSLTITALQGSGNVFLGSKNLNILGSDGKMIISGSIQDGSGLAGVSGSVGGSLTYKGAYPLILTGVNTYTGATTDYGDLQFGKETSFYGGTNSYWTPSNLIVKNGATLVLNVGGPGEFTSADVIKISSLGTNTGGFQSGAYLGLDTINTPSGNFVFDGHIANPNGGHNSLALETLGNLKLTGSNSYSGGTVVGTGTLTVDYDGSTTFGTLGTGGVQYSGWGGTLRFLDSANAGNNAITNWGGNLLFQDNSTGGTGAVQLGSGTLDISAHFGTSSVTLGSLATDSNSIVYLGANNLTVGGNNSSTTIACVIQDGGMNSGTGGSLTKVGTGQLTLTGANTYSGPTVVSGGILAVDYQTGSYATNFGRLGSGPVTVNSGAAPWVAGPELEFLDEASASGTIPIYGATVANENGGSVLLRNNSTATNTTLIAYGGSNGGGGSVVFNDYSTATNATLIATSGSNGGGGGSIIFTANASGSGATVKLYGNGSGDGSNGSLDLSQVNWGGGENFPIDSLRGGGNVFLGDNTLVITGNKATTFSGLIQDGGVWFNTGGSLTMSGSGTLILSGQNTYTGVTTVNNGVVKLNSPENPGIPGPWGSSVGSGPLGNSPAVNPGSIVFNGGTLQYSSNNNFDYSGRFSTDPNQQINIDTNGQTVTFATALSSVGGSLTLNDSNTAASGRLILTALNTYSGPTTITGGTLDIGGGGATGSINTSSPVNLAGGALSLNLSGAGSQEFQSVTVAQGTSRVVAAAGNTLLIDSLATNPGTTVDFGGSGTIQATGLNTSGNYSVIVSAAGTAFATVNGNDWAVSNGGTIEPLSQAGSYVSNDWNYHPSNNVDVGGSQPFQTDQPFNPSFEVNTLRFNAQGLTLALQTSYVNTIDTGGILVTSAGINDAITPNGASQGSIQAGAGNEMVIINNGSLNISAKIVDSYSGASALTVSGSGLLTLSAQNSYTGVTTLNGCVVKLNSAENPGVSGPLGNSPASNPGSIVFNRATLQYSNLNNFDYSGRFSAAPNQRITIDTNGQAVTFASALSSAGGSVTLNDSNVGNLGSLTLSGLNTYAGSTNIQAGTLIATTVDVSSNPQSLGMGNTVNLGVPGISSGVLDYTGAGGTLDKAINALGNGYDTVENTGSGNLILSGVLTKNGTKLNLSSVFPGSIHVTGDIVGPNPNSDLNITGGLVVLSGNNSYNGPTNLMGGTLQVSSASNLGSGPIDFNGGVLEATQSMALNNAIVVNNTASELKIDAGTVTLNGAVSGALETSGSGSLALGTGGSIMLDGSVSTPIAVSGGSVNFGGHLFLHSPTLSLNTGLLNFRESSNAGSTMLSASGGTVSFADNSSAGGATIDAEGGTNGAPGTKVLFTGFATGGSARAITNGNAFLDLSGLSTGGMAIGSIEGSGNYFVGSKTLTVGGNNQSTTVSGSISDGGASGGTGGSLVKTGSGTLTLAGQNSYTGPTMVNNGSLAVNGDISKSSSVLLSAGAILAGSGKVSQIAGAGTIFLSDPTILTASNVDSSSGLAFDFALTLAGSPNYGDPTASGNDILHLTGSTPFVSSLTSANVITLDFSDATLADGQIYCGGFFTDVSVPDSIENNATFDYLGTSGATIEYLGLATVETAAFSTGTVTNGQVMEFKVTSVPEPSIFGLISIGAAGLLVGKWRRSSNPKRPV